MNQYHYYHSLRGRQRNEGAAENMNPERITDNADNNRVALRTEMPEVPEVPQAPMMPETPRRERAEQYIEKTPCDPDNVDPMADFPLAMAYVPRQYFRKMYSPEEGLSRGTLFKELDLPFMAAGGECHE